MQRDHTRLPSPCPDDEKAKAGGRARAEERDQHHPPSSARADEQQQEQEVPIHSRADLDALLSRGDGACVVLFTSESCSPCKRIEPSYRALRRSFDGSGVRFARAEVGGDNDPNAAATDSLASELDVSTLPTWVCLRGGGGEVARVEGVRHKRPLQPVAAAVRRRLLLQPLGAAEGDDDA